MATHGRGGLKRLVLGSVADEVVKHAETPVLVFRPTQS
jgi:nucleotide-binding universal stress UspA family protein